MNQFARIWMICLAAALSSTGHAATVQILAASSLTESLTEITGEHTVSLNFNASGRIATQALNGAPADIIALAHPQWLSRLEGAGIVYKTVPLLGNQLVLATRKSEFNTIQNLSTLHHAERIAIGSEGTPAGQYAREAIRALGLEQELQSKLLNANNVRAAIEHLSSGTVDASFVYRTDLATDPSLHIRFIVDPGLHTPIEIPFILTQTGSQSPNAVALFDRITSDEGKAIFLKYGFSIPTKKVNTFKTAPATAKKWTAEPVILSVWVGLLSILLSILPALAIGWLLARREFRYKAVLSTLCLMPLVLPPVVTGWILLQLISILGIPVAFTQWAAVIAATVVGFPLLLILTRQAIESVDIRYSQLGETLGLTPFEAFRRITLPMALPGITAGCVLALARALGEFGATAMIAGDQPGETRTLALAVYGLAEQPGGAEPAAIMVGFSVVITLIALVAYERLVWRQRQLTGEHL